MAGVLAGVLWLTRDRLTSERVARAFRAGFTLLLYVIVASLVVGTFAARWGFQHMSQFSRDYRRFFGQLPSETLRSV